MTSLLTRLSSLTLFAALLLSSLSARAHEVMGTVIMVDLGRTRVHLQVQLPVDELRLALDQTSTPGIAALPTTGPAISAYVLDHLKLTTRAGAPFVLSASAGDVLLHDARNWQHVEIEATPPANASPRDFVLWSDVINHRVVSHHVFVFLRNDVETGQLGEPVYLDTLHYQLHEAPISRAPGSLSIGFSSVFRLGLSHIAEGTDHLLFLLALLLPASLSPSTRFRWGRQKSARAAASHVARIVTAFTIGHSITLLLGSLGLARLPSALVESLIAASVMVSAAHALVPIFPGRETWVALVFGLVHGLGFASALAGLGVDGSTLALTVLGFNLGIEAMQVLVVLMTLPSLYLLEGTRLGSSVRVLGGVLTLLTGAAWLTQRALGQQVPLLSEVDALLQHGPWLLGALALLALLARRIELVTQQRSAS